MSGLAVQILGNVRVWRDGAELDLGPLGRRAVFGLLTLAAGQPLSQRELIDTLWGDRPPASATNVLQTHVKHLRRLLEPLRPARAKSSRLPMVGNGYALCLDSCTVDMLAFRELACASASAAQLGKSLEHWQGSPLADIPQLAGHPKVVALAGERRHALARYAEAMMETDRADEVLAVIAGDAAAHPLDESAQARLMRGYHACGQRARAADVYEAARRLLAEELGVDPGVELTAAYTRLLREDRPVRPAPRRTALRQLPADVSVFVGRGHELGVLDRMLATGTTTALICGTAGIGKTALALHWGHRAESRFPDGQLYLDLRGYDPQQSLSTSQALGRLLNALGVAGRDIPPAEDQQAALLRTEVADKTMLLVLDNASSVNQIRHLLPGTNKSFALLTSRDSMGGLVALQGAQRLELGPLPQPEAVTLLRELIDSRVDREPESAAILAGQCARLPLALRVAAELAATRPGQSLADLVSELSDRQHRLDLLDAGGDARAAIRIVFSWSYQHLSPGAARLFRLLGLHAGPEITITAAASLAGLTGRNVRSSLAELTRANLLTESVPGRFAFHDLLRAYANEQTSLHDSAADRTAAMRRMFDHYLRVSHAGAGLLDPLRDPVSLPPVVEGVSIDPLSDHRAALGWFATEHAVLIRAVEAAGPSGFDYYGWLLGWSLANFLEWQGHWLDLVSTQQAALDAARRLGDVRLEAMAGRFLARALARLGKCQDAEDHMRESLRLTYLFHDRVEKAQAHTNLCWIFELQGKHRESLRHAQRGLLLFQQAGHRVGEARALNLVGWSNAQLGDHRRAVSYCRRGLKLLESVGDRSAQAHTWDSLGYSLHQMGRHRQAIDCYQRALEIFRSLGDRYNEAEILHHLGNAHDASRDAASASAAWRQALRILEELNHPTAERVRELLG